MAAPSTAYREGASPAIEWALTRERRWIRVKCFGMVGHSLWTHLGEDDKRTLRPGAAAILTRPQVGATR